MTLAILTEPDVGALPPASPVQPATAGEVVPLRAALGLPDNPDSGVVTQARCLTEAHPQSPVAFARLAQALAEGEEACAAARSAIHLAGRQPQKSAALAVHAAAIVLAANGADDAANALKDSTLPSAALLRAGIAAGRMDHKGAIRELEGATGPLAHAMRGWLLAESEPHHAVRELRAAIALGLWTPDVLTNLGFALAALGSTRKAIRFTREATVQAPASVEAANNLSVYLHRTGRNVEALRELERIADVLPNNPDLAVRQAWAQIHFANDGKAALRQLKSCRERFYWTAPGEFRSEVDAGIAFLEHREGRRDLASTKAKLWKSFKATPTEETSRMLASLLSARADLAELRELVGTAGPSVSEAVRCLLGARVASIAGKLDDAIALASRSAELAPFDTEIVSFASYLMGEGAGQYERAAEIALRAYNRNPDSGLLNNAAFFLAFSGDVKSAAKLIRDNGAVENLPFGGATAALIDLASGRVALALSGYESAIEKVRSNGQDELAALVDWRRRLAMAQLNIPRPAGEDLLEPPGSEHDVLRLVLRRVAERLATEAS